MAKQTPTQSNGMELAKKILRKVAKSSCQLQNACIKREEAPRIYSESRVLTQPSQTE